nr:unnamed protein product [Callosobruchus analis]
MNILPKKRWHVRNKDNIARVRADEAKAAEEEKQKQERIKLAEREARRELLLKKSRITRGVAACDIPEKTNEKVEDHVNFFKDLEDNVAESKGTNKEHDKRVKEEREKYEKQIGYLTYLGQDTNEALGKKNWYDVLPDRSDTKGEVNLKSKVREDPLEVMKKHLPVNQPTSSKQTEPTKYSISYETSQTIGGKRKRESYSEDSNRHKQNKKKKHKNKKRKWSGSEESCSDPEESELKQEKQRKLEMLRAERIRREKEERRRTEELLAKVYGTDDKKDCQNQEQKSFKPRYNSQFNPELAKQNYK